MQAALGISWFVALLLSVFAIYKTIGLNSMVSFFPESRRWWMLPSQMISLWVFAALCINHPF